MEDKHELISEEKILEAAKRVFQRSGYSGARMQEIADEAGINKAMLHYYYRSKDNLFESVFAEAIQKLVGKVSEMLNSDKPFEKKVRYFVANYIELLQKNEYLPLFVMNELSNNPERLNKFMQSMLSDKPLIFIQQIRQEINKKNIMPVDPRHIMVNMLALCIFPFAAKSLLKAVLMFSDEEYNSFIEERKSIIPEMLFKSLRP